MDPDSYIALSLKVPVVLLTVTVTKVFILHFLLEDRKRITESFA